MPLGQETQKSHQRRIDNGDYDKYFKGKGIDVGYRGYRPNVVPVAGSIGVDTDYSDYDGVHLPFDDESLDFVHSSHCLEHVRTDVLETTLKEWYRVLKVGGYMITTVPHMMLYEKKLAPPSRYNRDHQRFYTPARLLQEFEAALPLNGFRVRRLFDNDEGHDYSKGPEHHANANYEIELIIEKIAIPDWELK